MQSPASFHSNTRGLNTTTVQLKAMGSLRGVPLIPVRMEARGFGLHTGETVMSWEAVYTGPVLVER